jgi:hypothetical protein
MVQTHLLLDLLHLEAVREQMDRLALGLQQLEVLAAAETERLLEVGLLEHLDKVLRVASVPPVLAAVEVEVVRQEQMALEVRLERVETVLLL